MIQGTVSLDDERDDDCTVILPGMHKHLEEWAHMLKERGWSPESFVHRIQEKMFTSDEKHFHTQWTAQPCRAGQVESPTLIFHTAHLDLVSALSQLSTVTYQTRDFARTRVWQLGG